MSSSPFTLNTCLVRPSVRRETFSGPSARSIDADGAHSGKHLRHARDHFTLLLDCVTRPQPYILSYDVRSRNTPMEISREAARIAIENTIAQLKEIVPNIPLDAPITLQAITPYSQTMQTTFGREVLLSTLPTQLL